MSKEEREVYTISEIKDETRDVKTFRFDRNIMAVPGQFVMAWLPGVSENPFSVAYNNPFGITAKRVGDENSFTSRLFELKVGDKLWVCGPHGKPFPLPPVGEESDFSSRYLYGGGTGAIPLAFLSEVSAAFGSPPEVFLGAKTKDDILFEERFENSSEELYITTEDGSYGYKGLVTDLFDQIKIGGKLLFYVCGPEKMMKAVAEEAAKYTNPENIFLSLERYMKCGRGICGSCEVNGYRACVDGPVFTYSQLMEGDFGRYSRAKSGIRKML